MLQTKHIAAAIGIFGSGILIGWAATADYYAKKLQTKQAYIDELRRRPVGRLLDAKITDMGMEAQGVLFSEDEVVIPFVKGLHPDDLGETAEKPRGSDSDGMDEAGETDGEPEIDEAGIERERARLQSIIDEYTANPEDVDKFTNMALQEHVGPDNTPPFVISKDLFAWDEMEGDNYAKITVTYYPQYRVVLDDGEDVMDDVNSMLGWKNLKQFGGESGDPNVVFIRNRRLLTDFEVVRDEENDVPLHIKYGMGREEFETTRAAGMIRLREEDL